MCKLIPHLTNAPRTQFDKNNPTRENFLAIKIPSRADVVVVVVVVIVVVVIVVVVCVVVVGVVVVRICHPNAYQAAKQADSKGERRHSCQVESPGSFDTRSIGEEKNACEK